MFTRFISKFLGFKGLTFVISTVGMFLGEVQSHDWVIVALSCSGLKVAEDACRLFSKNGTDNGAEPG